jgi:hypothetical protein
LLKTSEIWSLQIISSFEFRASDLTRLSVETFVGIHAQFYHKRR